MGVSYAELRSVCQRPVADGNDVAGLLFGDQLSLPLTKLLVDRGWSPNVATLGMLACGLLGSALQFFGPLAAAAGAVLLLLYYLLDCTDGEVARWRRSEHARWGYYEYIFHFVVKPTAFLCVGFALWQEFGTILPVLAGALAAVATLWLKLFFATPAVVFTGTVFGRQHSGNRPYGEYLERAVEHASTPQPAPAPASASREVFRLRWDAITLRALSTNFDVGLLLLLAATLTDLARAPFEIPGLGLTSVRGLWLLYYGLVLPLDFVDYVVSYARRGHFDREMVRLLSAAHGFRMGSEG